MRSDKPHITFVIWDTETRRRYVAVSWDDKEMAERELEDLLRPYPEGHEWRKRLKVMPRERP